MQILLSQSGYDVRTQTDPRAALEMLKEEEFHVVVLDIMMPEISGMEMLERIRDFDSDISIIIFTGYPSVDTAVNSMKYNVSDYIKKPFDVDERSEEHTSELQSRPHLVCRLLLEKKKKKKK